MCNDRWQRGLALTTRPLGAPTHPSTHPPPQQRWIQVGQPVGCGQHPHGRHALAPSRGVHLQEQLCQHAARGQVVTGRAAGALKGVGWGGV